MFKISERETRNQRINSILFPNYIYILKVTIANLEKQPADKQISENNILLSYLVYMCKFCVSISKVAKKMYKIFYEITCPMGPLFLSHHIHP